MAWTERYVTTTGAGAHDGTSEANAWSMTEAIAAYAAGQRLNVKAGTYSSTSDFSYATAGTTSSPIWWRGYNTTIGDIDSDNSLTKPLLSMSSAARINVSAAYQLFSNLRITSDNTFRSVYCTAGDTHFLRCRIENTGSARCVGTATNKGYTFSRCHFTGTTGAPCFEIDSGGGSVVLEGCSFHSGTYGFHSTDSSSFRGSSILRCIFDSQTDHAIYISSTGGGTFVFDGNSIYNTGSGKDGIRINDLDGSVYLVSNNIFSVIGGYAINNSTGVNTARIRVYNNLYHSVTSGQTNGLGDWPNQYTQTDSSSPFVNAGSDDFTVASGSNALGNASPGAFEAI